MKQLPPRHAQTTRRGRRLGILVFALTALPAGRGALRAPGSGIPPVWTEPVTGIPFVLVL
jgi:hypothetical protein